MKRIFDWLAGSGKVRFADLVFAGYRGVCSAELHRKLPFGVNEWLCVDSDNVQSGWRPFVRPGLYGFPDWLIPREHLLKFFQSFVAVKFPNLVVRSAFQTPESSVQFGWSMLVRATAQNRVVDSMENAIALAIIGLGIAGLRQNSYCELCFRIAAAGRFRCELHSRSKSAQSNEIRPSFETDSRIARRLLPHIREDDNAVGRLPNISGYRWMLGYSVPYLPVFRIGSRVRRLSDVRDTIIDIDEPILCTGRVPILPERQGLPAGFCEADATIEWVHEEHLLRDPADTWIAISLREIALKADLLRKLDSEGTIRRYLETSPRVLRRLGEDILAACIEEQVARLRAIIDPDNPSLDGLMLSIRMAEQWYELADKFTVQPRRQAMSQVRAAEIRGRILRGEKKADIAKSLGISASNLSNLLKRYPQPRDEVRPSHSSGS